MARILIIRTSALGDVAMTLPVIYSVCRQYPQTEFCLLTRPFFAKIFVNAPTNLKIIPADFKKEYRGVKGLCRLIGVLKAGGFTHVADLHNVLRSWVIDAALRLSGAKVAMIDKMRRGRIGKALKKARKPFVERYADVFSALGYPVDVDFTTLYDGVGPSSPVEVVHPAVGIAPFARYANKTYPLEQMEQVVKGLLKHGVNVYLFGSRGREASILDGWAKLYGCTSLAGKMDITDELAAMHHMDAMITMDSANHHLAAIAGTKVVSIWGSTTPVCGFGGYRQRPEDAIVAGLDCQPCTVAGSPKCPLGTMACMRLLAPDKIIRHTLDALRRNI